jgi:hypothetical protein
MKRYLLSVLFVLTTLFACSKISTDNYADAIIGTWQLNKGVHYTNGKQDKTEKPDYDIRYSFGANGSFILEVDGEITDSGTYFVTDTYLTLISLEYGRPDQQRCKIKLTKNELIFIQQKNDEEAWLYFTRVH